MTTGKWIGLGVLAAGSYIAYKKRKKIAEFAIRTAIEAKETWGVAMKEVIEYKEKRMNKKNK